MYQVGMSLAMTGHPLHGAAVVSQPAGGSVGETLELSKEELRRRVASLPSELSRWQSRAKAELDMNIHLSQLRALDNLVAAFTKDQLEMVEALNPHGNRGQFLQRGFDVVNEIIRAQGIWDFYREKFQLRFSPDFKAALRVADITAWDCYRPVVENAADLGILPSARFASLPSVTTRPTSRRRLGSGEVNLPTSAIARGEPSERPSPSSGYRGTTPRTSGSSSRCLTRSGTISRPI